MVSKHPCLDYSWQGLSGEMAQESKALEDKLSMLKDQLSDLRTSIKVILLGFSL
jgi:hypothetical protein